MIRVFWDTNLFIYLWEDYGVHSKKVRALMNRMVDRGDKLCTSTMTLGEVLVSPIKAGRTELAADYEAVLTDPDVLLISFDRSCARTYALVRQDKTITPPDAIQLSCAAQAGCDLFITNDERLSRKTMPGIHFIVSLDRAFL